MLLEITPEVAFELANTQNKAMATTKQQDLFTSFTPPRRRRSDEAQTVAASLKTGKYNFELHKRRFSRDSGTLFGIR